MASSVELSHARESHNLILWRSAAFDGIVLSRGTGVTHPYPRHWHEELHLCAYVSGSGYVRFRGSSSLLTEGDFVVTPPGEVHENWVDSESGISFRGVYVDTRAFRKTAEQIIDRDLPILNYRELILRDKLVGQRFLAMHQAAERRTSQLEQEEALLMFLHPFLSWCSHERHPDPHVGYERSTVKRARQYIDDHFAESISLAFLGQLANLSPFHLHRTFCREIGMPPHAYQTQVRINRAKQLLRQRHPLSAVALYTGFADQSHLTRHFFRLVGVTPGRFLS